MKGDILHLLFFILWPIGLSEGDGDGGYLHSHHLPQTAEEFHGKELVQDKEHIREEMEELGIKVSDDMSDEELAASYFHIHDYDNNSMLDGLEILKSGIHELSHGHTLYAPEVIDTYFQVFVDLIEKLLVLHDKNNDGYLSYIEYVNAKRDNSL